MNIEWKINLQPLTPETFQKLAHIIGVAVCSEERYQTDVTGFFGPPEERQSGELLVHLGRTVVELDEGDDDAYTRPAEAVRLKLSADELKDQPEHDPKDDEILVLMRCENTSHWFLHEDGTVEFYL